MVSARILVGDEGASECVELLRKGGVVGVPTETVYGLAADAFQPMAVARIFEAKGRPLTDPLIIHLPEVAWLERVVRFESKDQRNIVERLGAAFWPGPLTLILPKHARSGHGRFRECCCPGDLPPSLSESHQIGWVTSCRPKCKPLRSNQSCFRGGCPF